MGNGLIYSLHASLSGYPKLALYTEVLPKMHTTRAEFDQDLVNHGGRADSATTLAGTLHSSWLSKAIEGVMKLMMALMATQTLMGIPPLRPR